MSTINDLEHKKFKRSALWGVYLETVEGKPPFSNDLKWLTIHDLNKQKFTEDGKIRVRVTF
jgi:hypothetical protein